MKIGFIGQGYVGKNMADSFEDRGFEVIRYSLEKEHIDNKDKIKECDIVYICVPTPTTPDGFNDRIIESVLGLVKKVAVIKSTILPGTTDKMQEKFKDIIILHSPEFLTEVTARYDVDHPKRNIFGVSEHRKDEATKVARELMKDLPSAPFQAIYDAKTAELIKYANNCWFYSKVVFINIIYDICQKYGLEYENIREALSYDTRIGFTHLDPIHKSGRGAGGHCFIKDFAAFKTIVSDEFSKKVLEATENKNFELLKNSNKDLDLIKEVYGDSFKNML